MSIKNILLAGAAVTMLASTAMAAEPMKLTDSQMDDVAAGFTLTGALGLTGGLLAINHSSLKFKERSKISTKETLTVTGTGLNSLQQTTASASISGTALSTGGAQLQTGGTLAVGFSLTAP